MIEVTGCLCRGAVYFTGEVIKCLLVFRNVGCSSSESRTAESDGSDTVAWASAQIVCSCNVSESRTRAPDFSKDDSQKPTVGQDVTSLIPHKDEHGHCVLQTKLKILFCDLKLRPGEEKEVCFSDTIPHSQYPSYRGASIKYSYKIAVAMQRVGAPVRVLRVPFRVLVLYGITDFELEQKSQSSSIFIPSPKPANLLDVVAEVLSTVTSRKNSHDYKIGNADGTIAIFTLLKGSVKLGEDIVGVFDFSAAKVLCVQFYVYLQSEEVCDEGQSLLSHGNATSSYERHTQFCLFLKKTHISIPVPLHCTPGFLTDLVCLRWRLHFEFVIVKGPLKTEKLDTLRKADECMFQGPAHFDTAVVSWDLPVRIMPTMPNQAETGGNAQNCRLLF